MDVADLEELVRFSPDGLVRQPVFETDRLWSELVCFDRTQTLGPVIDHDSDGIVIIVAGEAVVFVGNRRRRLGQWAAVLVPSGAELTIRNAAVDPLVVLLVAAPPPVPRAVSG